MPKGKKFNAAQKHFSEKEAKLKKQLADAQRDRLVYYQKVKDQYEIIRSLSAKVDEQEAWIERLLEYTELDVKDIKQSCEKDKAISELGYFAQSIFSAINKRGVLRL